MTSDTSGPGSAGAYPFPERLGRYEVLLPIASGGMATVYLARAVGPAGFEREVALKLTHAHLRELPDFVTSLMDEARLAGRIRHPNVVSVLDVGEDPHGVFIVMDYVEGDSLASLLRMLKKRGERVPLEIGLRIVDDMLAGLHAAHELKDSERRSLNLVHRDVTPHNVLVSVDGVTRLTDFGVAKATSRLGQTSSGLIKGKIAYMSPEQAQGDVIDRRADVWAAGVVAWELFAGTRLFTGSNDAVLLLKVVHDQPTRLSHVVPDLPPEIDAVVARALERDVAGRFPTAEAFADALSQAATKARLVRAEARAVAAFVRPLFFEKLETRIEKVQEIQTLRRRMGQLAELRSSPSHATPSALALGEGTATLSSVHLTPLDATETRAIVPSEAPGEVETSASALGIATLAQSSAAKRSRVVPALLMVLTLFALVVLVFAFRRKSEPPVAASAPPSNPVVPIFSAPTPEPSTSLAPPPASVDSAPKPAKPPRREKPRAASKNCDPPYIIDSRGIQIFKPECL